MKNMNKAFPMSLALFVVVASDCAAKEPAYRRLGAEPRPLYTQGSEERFSRRYQIGLNGSFSLSNISGDVVVRGGSGEEVVLEAVKRVHRSRGENDIRRLLESVDIDVSHTRNRVRVTTRHSRGRGEHRRGRSHVSVDYEITVPGGTEVSVKCVSGNVELHDLDGETTAESVSGDVTLRRVEHLVLAKSVSGDVTVSAAASPADLEISSVSGDVEIGTVSAEELDVSSVSGDVRISQASCERATVHSVSGDIRYGESLTPSGRYDFKSHSGDVHIVLSESPGFELEAKTFSGEIESDF
ncbi:MAG: DUF4097 domain-containing protein, partial [Acidobacteriota bacterium]